jgi:hypothetical protein
MALGREFGPAVVDLVMAKKREVERHCPSGAFPTPVWCFAANGSYQMIQCCIQNLCINSGEPQYGASVAVVAARLDAGSYHVRTEFYEFRRAWGSACVCRTVIFAGHHGRLPHAGAVMSGGSFVGGVCLQQPVIRMLWGGQGYKSSHPSHAGC